MQKEYFIVPLLIVLIFFVYQRNERSSEQVTSVPERVNVEVQAEEAQPVSAPVKPISAVNSDVRNLRKIFPDKNEVKNQIEENPHQTPESLIRFAEQLGSEMDKALKNPDKAKSLVKGLRECVNDDSVVVSARTLCLSKAEQLAKTYPELRNNVQMIQKNADGDVLELQRKQKVFLR